METENKNQDGKFSKMVKRIWNGPYENEEEENSQMRQDRPGETNYNTPSYPPRAEYGAPDDQETRRIPVQSPVQPEFHTPQNQRYDFPPANHATDLHSAQPSGNSTTISRGTVIVGDIKSDSDIEMLGTVTGNITTTGNVRINGKQIGDVQGTNVELISCVVRGSLSASDDVSVDSESVIVGDVKCGNLTFDGKIKGNVHVMGNVNCQPNAVILGDITSTTIAINSGAKLRGNMEISDGSIDPIDVPDDGTAGVPKQ